jgi:NitT/TauT family transport system ATP-binding protein
MKDNNSRLVIEKVSHHYDSLSVLHNFNLEVHANEIVVLVGPSGCGKTTILNLLSGHFAPAAGSITRNGIVRTVYQQDGLFPWLTVAENISLGLRSIEDANVREHELRELLQLIHMEDFIDHYPHQLSGGMRQRVELARAVAGESDILLMDEPFSALDYQARLRMRHELVRLLEKKPRTVVFVTHDIEEAAQLADRIFVLSKRPATICRELAVKSPKPRGLTDAATINAMNDVLKELGLEEPNNSGN